jgi:uncharacterized protein (TIGR04255 family)
MDLNTRPEHLPDFSEPPLVEVVLGVQFGTVAGFRMVHAGLLWQEYRQQFPHFAEQPPLDPAFETTGPIGATDRGLRIEVASGVPIPRLWFINEDQTQLIQFQPDRFIYNWRKMASAAGADYPRYEAIRARFMEQYHKLKAFFRVQGFDDVDPNQCEITYVNHLRSMEKEDLASSLGKVLRVWTDPSPAGALAPVEDYRLLLRCSLQADDGTFLGRLTLAAEPAGRQDKASVVRLILTARGIPLEHTDDGILRFFDLGRDRIVRAFTEITTDQMHSRWGRLK